MKRINLLLFGLLVILSACFKDEGNYNYATVDEIEISGLEEMYRGFSYAGEVLTISPEIKTDYTDLSYEWYMWSPDIENYQGANMTEKEEYEATLIGTDKDLNYELACPEGRYTIMLKVTSNTNNYFAVATTRLDVTTEFSRGFYILKETETGGSELDLSYDAEEPVMENLITQTGNEPLEGKPLCLGILPSYGYIDKNTNEIKPCHSVCVTTEKGEIVYYNTTDMQAVHDREDIFYSQGGMPDDQMPYASFCYGMTNYLLTNKGVDMGYVYQMTPTSGVFAKHSDESAGRFFFEDAAYYASDPNYQSGNIYYWDETNHRINFANCMYMGTGGFIYDDNGFTTEGMECLACGCTQTQNKGFFLLKDQDGTQYLYVIDVWNFRTSDRIEIKPDSKLAQATAYAFNALTANYMYFIYRNQLYTYDLNNYTESATPLTLNGISNDETITYLAYHWQNYSEDEDYNFTHLMVGTQKGNQYRVYAYNISGGEPNKLVRTMSGEGKVKMVGYMPAVEYFYDNYGGGDTMSVPN